jgi:hypothetical protein
MIYTASAYTMKTLIVTLAACMIGCASSREMTSTWRTGEEPKNPGVYLPEQRVSVEVRNDDRYVYVAIEFADRRRQILMQGLTVWIDPAGGQERTFGIRYPLGMMATGRPPETDAAPEAMPDFQSMITGELEILGPSEGEQRRMSVGEAGRLSVSIDEQKGSVSYRARIPMADSGVHPSAIGCRPGATIGLGIEIAGRSERPGGVRRSRPEGMAGRRGAGGSEYPGRPDRRPEPLEFWIKVKLADRPS